MSELVLFTSSDAVATLTLNIPEQRNAISDLDVIDALLAALARAQADTNIRVIILTGAGPVFSSGGNLKKMGESGGLNSKLPAQTRRNYQEGIQRIPLAFEALELPVIAAVNGPAIGAGCDLACMCDLRIAAESARFAESFVKVGIVPGDGGAWLLPRVIGFAKAAEMALTGDAIDAAEALRIGLISQVVADAELMPAARALAARIAVNPPLAVRMTRRLLHQAYQSRLDTVLEISAAMQALAHATEDHKEAVAAMLGKRTGKFTGK
jgi:enoyl-CoA hydratase/carnithine racemase